MYTLSKVLILNRGEIASRIVKTLKKMNIKSAVLCSDIDRNSPHVLEADEFYHLPGIKCADTYLNKNVIIEIIKKNNIDAVHPGYGFFAEDTGFAKDMENINVNFIGPNSDLITLMGDKVSAKKVAKKAGVNIVDGFLGNVESLEHAVSIANSIGYPVILKAAAGGGGRGIRIVFCDDDLKNELPIVQQEAKNSFANDSIFLEKYIERPRHIEVQVIADKYGNITCLGERECSIQRRYQKVIEEAPSCFITEDIREQMYSQVKKLVREIGYYSAGTVEFLVDQKKQFYFSEMNTRIQVEHPITEMITGVDIVEEMVNIAQSKTISIKQKDVVLKGHAIEARICSEEPFNKFSPTRGIINYYTIPEQEANHNDIVRVDSGVMNGSQVDVFYDTMVAKLCVKSNTREEAIDSLVENLDKFSLGHLGNNITFLQSIVLNKKFKDGMLHTGFLEEIFPNGFLKPSFIFDVESIKIFFASILLRINLLVKDGVVDINSLLGNWYISLEDQYIKLRVSNISNDGDCVCIEHNNNKYTCKFYNMHYNLPNVIISLLINNKEFTFKCIKHLYTYDFVFEWKQYQINLLVLQEKEFKILDIVRNNVSNEDEIGNIISPISGMVQNIMVKVGERVVKGQALFVIEAMKSLNSIEAQTDGIVEEVNFSIGDQVSDGETVVYLKCLN